LVGGFKMRGYCSTILISSFRNNSVTILPTSLVSKYTLQWLYFKGMTYLTKYYLTQWRGTLTYTCIIDA